MAATRKAGNWSTRLIACMLAVIMCISCTGIQALGVGNDGISAPVPAPEGAIKGNMAGVIPEEGINTYSYYVRTPEGIVDGLTWTVEAENPTGLSVDENGTLSIGADAEDCQTIPWRSY